MKNLERIYDKCVDIMNEQGILHHAPYNVTVNNRFKRTWGRCVMESRYGGVKHYSIYVNPILLDDRNSDKGLEETLLHELIHTVDGCWNHGKKFQRLARQINNIYNYNIKTRSSENDKGISEECQSEIRERREKQRMNYKYAVTCKKCGNQYKYKNLTNVVKYPWMYRCKCGGELYQSGDIHVYSARNH